MLVPLQKPSCVPGVGGGLWGPSGAVWGVSVSALLPLPGSRPQVPTSQRSQSSARSHQGGCVNTFGVIGPEFKRNRDRDSNCLMRKLLERGLKINKNRGNRMLKMGEEAPPTRAQVPIIARPASLQGHPLFP